MIKGTRGETDSSKSNQRMFHVRRHDQGLSRAYIATFMERQEEPRMCGGVVDKAPIPPQLSSRDRLCSRNPPQEDSTYLHIPPSPFLYLKIVIA